LIRTAAMVSVLALLPLVVQAQGGDFGLDLTAPEEEEAKTDELDLRSTPAPTEEQRKPAASRESLLEGERDVTVEDRVKSVQRKLYLKKNRFELAPSISYAVNDPYYAKYGATVRGAYYLQDTLAVSARFALLQVNPTDDVRTAKRTFQSRIFFSVPQWAAMGGVEWSPIYGKVSIWNNILHFDSYVVGGLGVVTTETSSLPNRGPNPAMDLGVGVRFVARDYIAVNASLINTSYVDVPANSFKGVTQNVMMLNTGISLFLPFKSTTREAE
jgi:outer membrane beta-barrel protein